MPASDLGGLQRNVAQLKDRTPSAPVGGMKQI